MDLFRHNNDDVTEVERYRQEEMDLFDYNSDDVAEVVGGAIQLDKHLDLELELSGSVSDDEAEAGRDADLLMGVLVCAALSSLERRRDLGVELARSASEDDPLVKLGAAAATLELFQDLVQELLDEDSDDEEDD